MQIERVSANETGLAQENPFEQVNCARRSEEKILDFYDKLGIEEQACFFLFLTALADRHGKLAAALEVYFRSIGKEKPECAEPPNADVRLLQRIKTCVTDPEEFKAWGRLFAHSIIRNDHFCFEAAETAARIRVSH
ncbi:hypothetical protein RA27_15075 [Ruegeria sp. ANG-R]|uniref:hypothetical protein n=1 Tax=Ruegeria sp. ANG-R TaxID=1577903 RepID=UPI00057C5650|nr:hypothetical protein [Ruegeria sp. ANG-R]KIC40153.1 hypothetical protein RA27_15075 [Ruegeria sp. ANG-R]